MLVSAAGPCSCVFCALRKISCVLKINELEVEYSIVINTESSLLVFWGEITSFIVKNQTGSVIVVARGTHLSPVVAVHSILAVTAATNGGERLGETSPRNCFAIKIAFPRAQGGF